MRPVKLQLIQKVEDLGPLYWIGAEAWKEDAGFNWFFPGGRENPGHFLELWKIILQGDFFEKGMFVVAATLERDEEPGRKQVVGFSVWERRGSSNAAKRWQGTSLSNSMRSDFFQTVVVYSN